MDPSLPNNGLQDALDDLTGITDHHNGYFGDLCISFNDIRGEMMLRSD